MTHADMFIEDVCKLIRRWPASDVELKRGIVTITFHDGSIVDFTEPLKLRDKYPDLTDSNLSKEVEATLAQ